MKNLFVSALLAGSLAFVGSPAFAKDGRTDPNPHTGSGSTKKTFYPSCQGAKKGQFCGGRAPGSSQKFYPSCQGGKKGKFCGGRGA